MNTPTDGGRLPPSLADEPLFDLPDGAYVAPPEPDPPESADRRRTKLQAERITKGNHPLSGPIAGYLRLHPDAPRDREGDGPRCGDCRFRQLFEHHNRTYAKCTARNGYRNTNSAASDVRAWWPACTDFEWGDPKLSPDAARCVPDGA